MADTAKTKGVTVNKGTDVVAIDKQAFLKSVDRAAKGDTKALAEVLALCKAHPELWDIISIDVAGTVRDAYVKRLTGDDLLVREAINCDLTKMMRDILGTNPSPLEKLLAERICACWVQVQYAEWRFATKKPGESFQLCDYLQRLVDRANHRYIAAIRALAQIRRLSVPMVQVNVAERQVNVAAPQMNAATDANPGMIAPPSTPALAAGDAPPLAQIVDGSVRSAERQTVA